MSFGARALIRLGALSHNLSVIRRLAPHAAVMAVVKANAYGHGLVDVVKALPDADSFAVARLSEAVELRQADVKRPIVLLAGVYSHNELDLAARSSCELVVHNEAQIELLEQCMGKEFVVWLKIDTGMHRLGFPPAVAAEMISRLKSCTAVGDLRLMTHLANADDRHDPKTDEQLTTFARISSSFEGDISIANSGGIFGWAAAVAPQTVNVAQRIWIRPGISLFGVSPFPELDGSDLKLKPVMQLESRLIATKPISAGESVGYGGKWIAERDSVIGIISAGYGDGLSRFLGNGVPLFINGRQAPLVGAVSMDMAAVDLGPDASDSVGDAVVLWGDELPVEEVARRANTIAYPLICGVMNRESSSVVA